MSTLLESSHGSSGSGSLTASGERSVSKKFDDLDQDRELDKISLYIMQEVTPFFLYLHYCRLCPWKYKLDGGRFVYNSFRGGSKDTHARLLIHDSVIVQYGANEWIKGEKGGEDAKMKVGGIRVFPLTDARAPEEWTDPEDTESGRYSIRFSTGEIELGKGRDRWTLRKLKELLRDSDDAYYHFLSANCWQYAHLGAEAVLEWVKSNALDAQVKKQVQAKLDQLKRLKRPQPLEVWRALRKDSPNRELLKQYRRKLSDTCEHLPPKSHVRKRACQRIKRVVIARCITRAYSAGRESDRFAVVRRVLLPRLQAAWQSWAQENVDHSEEEQQLVEDSAPSEEECASDEEEASDESEAEQDRAIMPRTKMGQCRRFEGDTLRLRISARRPRYRLSLLNMI